MLKKLSVLVVATAILLFTTGGRKNHNRVRQEEKRYQAEFPGREVEIVDWETLEAARALVPPARDHAYALDPRVGIEGDYYLYTVFTPHGTYTVKGLFALPEYCRQAQIIEMLLSSAIAPELSETLSPYFTPDQTPRGDFIITNVDSIKHLGRSFHKQFVDWENNGSTSTLDRLNRQQTATTPATRRYAYQLRTDVYSQNEALRALLAAENANAALVQQWLPRGTFFTPFAVAPAWGKTWALPGGKSASAEKFIRDDDYASIFKNLVIFYRDNLNLDYQTTPELQRLLTNIAYSPRQQVYIAWYLAQIQARNSVEALNYLALARTAFRAEYNFTQLTMLHALHCEGTPLARFIALQNQLAGLTKTRQLIVIPLWDHPRQRANVRHLLLEMQNFGKNLAAENLQLWFIGDCDQQVIDTAGMAGITVRANVANTDMFRFTPLRALTYRPQVGDPEATEIKTLPREEVIYQERAFRPEPVFKVQPKKAAASNITLEQDKPLWNGRLAIEKKLSLPPPPPKPLIVEADETASTSGTLPALGNDPIKTPRGDPLNRPSPEF